MASLFGHVAAAAALGQAAAPELRRDWRFWYMASLCAILPDADVAGFRFGIRYEDFWGHRGMTHSFVFAVLVGFAAAARFRRGWRLALLFAAITASHGLLDGLTNGGHGVAYFSPLDEGRYFLPWTPIEVSPIGARGFFSARGLAVLANELVWIGAPSALLALALRRLRPSAS